LTHRDLFRDRINFIYKKLMGKNLYGERNIPSSGLAFLKFIPNHPIFASKLLCLQSVSKIHNAWRHNRDVYYSECLEEIKNSIKDKFEYFDVVDSVWWEYFFNSQSDIILISRN
jgi:hypothetical protein